MDYYIYLASLNDIPRYVGFGRKKRFKHVNSGTSHVRKLNEVVLRDRKLFSITILIKGLSKSEASEKERSFIEKFGREDLGTGSLWNETNGGIGFRNYHTDKTKNDISNALRLRWSNYSTEERNRAKTVFLNLGRKTQFKKGSQPQNIGYYQVIDHVGNIVCSGTKKQCEEELNNKNINICFFVLRRGYRRGPYIGWKINKI